MLKRMIILAVLSTILIALVLIRSHTVTPVNTNTKSDNNSGLISSEYKISKISGNQYYGKDNKGTEINFSAEKIRSDDKIKVHDKVICYFEKDNLGKGIVRVEKKY
ncbi:MAG: hypothetical protein ABGX20_09475 [Bacillus sp. (in: firmicutes)]